MTTRVATFSAQQALISQMMRTQTQVNSAQTQVNTGQKSQDYTGLADDAFRLLNLEGQRDRLERYMSGNKVANLRVTTMQNSVDAAQQSLTAFKKSLLQVASYDYTDLSAEQLQSLNDIRSQGYQAMKDLQYYLNTSVDGRYLFGGGVTDTEPVSLPWKNVDDFAQVFDGNSVTYAESRAANLFDTKYEGRTIVPNNETIGSTEYGTFHDTSGESSMTFTVGNPMDSMAYGQLTVYPSVTGDNTKGLIVSDQPDAFSGLASGMTFFLDDGGSSGGSVSDRQSGVYTITSISSDGKTLTVEPPPPGDGTSLDPVQIANTDPSKITLTVPEGTRISVKNTMGQDEEYTVHWPTNSDLSAAGYDLTAITEGTNDLITGKRLFVTPAMATSSASYGTEQYNISLNAKSYYQGDTLTTTHRVDETRSVTVGINALDPAFEKAFRGLGILCQGLPLDASDPSGQTIDATEMRRRIDEATNLVSDALRHTTASSEEASDFTSLGYRLAGSAKTLDNAIEDGNSYLAFLENNIYDIEGISSMEAATKLTAATQTLEISYSALSRVNKLSLLNYL